MTVAAPIAPRTTKQEGKTVKLPMQSKRPSKCYHEFGDWRGDDMKVATPICSRHWMDATDSEGWRQAGATIQMLSHTRKLARGNQQDSTGNDE